MADAIKPSIEQEPWFGYLTVAMLLAINKNTVPQILKATPLFLLRSDNGLVECVVGTFKERSRHHHRFEIQQHAIRIVAEWIQLYTHRRSQHSVRVNHLVET